MLLLFLVQQAMQLSVVFVVLTVLALFFLCLIVLADYQEGTYLVVSVVDVLLSPKDVVNGSICR